MKIVCDSCATKYSISDDKVRGKVFKIRCKKCSHIIVVRGNNEGAAAAAGQPPAATSDGGWHLVVDGDQVGPLSDADVRGRLSRGEINAESFIWKDGFADWVKLSTVDEFAADLPAAADSTVGDGGGDLMPESNGAELGASVSAVASPANSGGLFGSISVTSDESEASNGADAGLGSGFGSSLSPSPSAELGGGELFAAQAAPRAGDDNRWSNSGGAAAAAASHDGGRIESLTAQRHENSVLFSLSNLQSLASPGGAAKPAPSSSSAGTPSPGSEGSGLIDIRAMAATTLGSPSDSRGGSNGSDDLPSFGSFSPAAPVLLSLPTPSGPPKWIYPAIAVMLALVGVIAWMAMKILSDKPATVVEAPVAPVAAPVTAPAAKPAEPVAAAVPPTPSVPAIPDEKLPPREPTGKPAEAAAVPAAKPDRPGKKGKGGRRGVVAEAGGGGGRASAPAVAAAAPTPAEPVGAKPAKGSLDELLEGAISSKPSKAAAKPREEERKPAAEPASAGPLSKNAIVAGMNGIKGKISDCYNQYKVPGMVMVNIVIGKSGKVSSATSTGKFAGTPTGTCVEKAVKTAAFPPSDGLTTPYPIVLK